MFPWDWSLLKEKQEVAYLTAVKLKEMELNSTRSIELEKIPQDQRKYVMSFIVGLSFSSAIYFGLSGYVVSVHRISASIAEIARVAVKIENFPVLKASKYVGLGLAVGNLLKYIAFKLFFK